MSDTTDLRALVLSHKGQWSRIARLTGLSNKTLSRIASGETPDWRSSTEKCIRSAIAEISHPTPEQAAQAA